LTRYFVKLGVEQPIFKEQSGRPSFLSCCICLHILHMMMSCHDAEPDLVVLARARLKSLAAAASPCYYMVCRLSAMGYGASLCTCNACTMQLDASLPETREASITLLSSKTSTHRRWGTRDCDQCSKATPATWHSSGMTSLPGKRPSAPRAAATSSNLVTLSPKPV